MSIQFNTNTANALINGASIPVPFIHQFVQDAYDSFNKLNETMRRLEDKERECSELRDKYEKS